jgi:signal transduction histidine kinase/ActR/RegA family two-component response regulator
MVASTETGPAQPAAWRHVFRSAREIFLVSPRWASGLAARLVFSAVVFLATIPYSDWPMPCAWMAVMALLAVAESRSAAWTGSGQGDNWFAWLQSAGYASAGFYLTFVESGAAQTFGVTLYGIVMFEILARDYVQPRRMITNLTPMLISMMVVQSAACIMMVYRGEPWRILTVLATTYLVFRGLRSVQVDLTQTRHELAQASVLAEASARRIREAHRIALMAETMAGIGHWRVDIASGVTTWSEGVYRIYGLEPNTTPPPLETLLQHYDPDERDELRARLQAAATLGEPFDLERRLTRRDGAVRHVVCHGAAELDASGRVETLFGAFMDVTEARIREEALRDAKLRAEAAVEAKSEFLANMSHEIRTPLTAINGFSSLLSELEDLPPTAGAYVRRVNTAGQTLLAVVNDILDFSKLGAGHVALDPQPFALKPFFDDLTAMFTAQAKGLTLRLDIDPAAPTALIADPGRLRQVVVNLVSNAIKFTDEGEIRISVAYHAGFDMLKVAVSDTGCGVPPDKRELLFQRFSQVDGSLSRRHGGTGLGLSICKGLVELMGGTIEMVPSAGGGSIFRFYIGATVAPLDPVAAPRGRKNATRATSAARILVVDDLDANRELVRAMLEATGHQVSEADNGSEALRLAAEQPFDLILMDLQMPGIDGFASARAIRQSDTSNRETPIIALSADVLPEHILASADAGMNGHIGKPISVAELLEAVARWSDVRVGGEP